MPEHRAVRPEVMSPDIQNGAMKRFTVEGFNVKIAEDFLQKAASSGLGVRSPGCSEDHRHDQEASSRMDNEGCPNGDNEEEDTLAEELSQDADTPAPRDNRLVL